jgi:sorbitol-specific phosphotransferase system component IIBC
VEAKYYAGGMHNGIFGDPEQYKDELQRMKVFLFKSPVRVTSIDPALAATAIVLTIACVVHRARRGQEHRPNVVLIVSDDLGYADIGVYGSRDIPTPNIDRIAREGVRFTDAYVSGPYCSPSRAGLMTAGIRSVSATNSTRTDRRITGLPLTETTHG